jgi:hypothetical protein
MTVKMAVLDATSLWAEFDARHWYWQLFIAGVAPVMISVPVVVPLYEALSLSAAHVFPPSVDTFHW